jgi:hypothetical protein
MKCFLWEQILLQLCSTLHRVNFNTGLFVLVLHRNIARSHKACIANCPHSFAFVKFGVLTPRQPIGNGGRHTASCTAHFPFQRSRDGAKHKMPSSAFLLTDKLL